MISRRASTGSPPSYRGRRRCRHAIGRQHGVDDGFLGRLGLLLSDTIVVLGAKVYRRVEALTRLQDIFGDVKKIQPPRPGGAACRHSDSDHPD